MSWIQENRLQGAVPTMQSMDFTGVALTPEEGFVLSRVDGHSTIEEICMATGLGEGKTLNSLAKLHESKLIEIPGAPGPSEPEPETAEVDSPEGGDDGVPTEAMVPPFAVEEGVQLSEEKQRDIHFLYYGLETTEFYDLLTLERGCTDRDIQRAYRKISMRYHPDRFFGKELGTYTAKLEAIFRHITNVVEYLSDDGERAAYEATLAEDAPEAAAEAPSSEELEPIRRRPRQLTKKDRLRRLGGVMGMSTKEVQAAARKRKGTPQPQPARGSLRTDKAPEVSAERKARIKKRRRKQTQQIMSPLVARKAKAKRHYEEGVKLLLAGNWAAAASNLKLATTFDPKNEEYAEKEAVATGRAREGSAAAYAKRAAFEESVGRWEEAARLYCMAAERNPSVKLYCLAADALSKGDDLKRAVEYATRAKDLEPNSIQARLSLGSAYLAADMPKNARREVEYALNLDSDNALAKSLMRDVKKADR